MKLRAHHVAELVGILLVLASTATQMFYVEPLQREISWRLGAFSHQQNSQLVARTVFDSRIATLKAVKAGEAEIAVAEAEKAATIAKFTTADANIADYLLAKEPVEDGLQIAVMVLFGIGTLLAGYGRLVELLGAHKP